MASDSELRNLGEALQVTLGMLQREGLEVMYEPHGPIKDTYRVSLYPVHYCTRCGRISAPRTYCLWCEDEGDGE